jgi:hypothetical protein
VLNQHPVEKTLVAVLQTGKVKIFFQIGCFAPDIVDDMDRRSDGEKTRGGSKPRNPRTSRSVSLNIVPLFKPGSQSSALPRGIFTARFCVDRFAIVFLLNR